MNDSVGDDLTILAAIMGLLLTQFEFINDQIIFLAILFGLFLIQLTHSLIRYKKMSSFHTYLAKIAAVVTAIFLLSVFFLDGMLYPLFLRCCDHHRCRSYRGNYHRDGFTRMAKVCTGYLK